MVIPKTCIIVVPVTAWESYFVPRRQHAGFFVFCVHFLPPHPRLHLLLRHRRCCRRHPRRFDLTHRRHHRRGQSLRLHHPRHEFLVQAMPPFRALRPRFHLSRFRYPPHHHRLGPTRYRCHPHCLRFHFVHRHLQGHPHHLLRCCFRFPLYRLCLCFLARPRLVQWQYKMIQDRMITVSTIVMVNPGLRLKRFQTELTSSCMESVCIKLYRWVSWSFQNLHQLLLWARATYLSFLLSNWMVWITSNILLVVNFCLIIVCCSHRRYC